MTTQRVIRKDGWLYWLAYGRRPVKKRPTGNVNLCDTVWLAAVELGVYVCIGFVIILCGGIVLAGLAGFCVIIWQHILPAVIAYLTSPYLPYVSEEASHMLWGVAIGLPLSAVILTLVYGTPSFFKTETGRLLVAYMRAKKDRVCPIYEVV